MNPVTVEGTVATYLKTDTPLVAEADGGIFTYTTLGRQGITRDSYPSSYNGSGYVKSIIVVKARAPIPITDIYDEVAKVVAQNQMIEFWMYQWVGYDSIERMGNHIHRLMQNHKFASYYPVTWDYSTGPLIDGGSLNGASLVRRDYLFRSIVVAA
jgi:hypothetical protein